MRTDEQGPASRAAEPQQGQESRALVLRLLRLVAAEVAAQLQRPGSAEPRSRQPRGKARPPGSNSNDGYPTPE